MFRRNAANRRKGKLMDATVRHIRSFYIRHIISISIGMDSDGALDAWRDGPIENLRIGRLRISIVRAPLSVGLPQLVREARDELRWRMDWRKRAFI